MNIKACLGDSFGLAFKLRSTGKISKECPCWARGSERQKQRASMSTTNDSMWFCCIIMSARSTSSSTMNLRILFQHALNYSHPLLEFLCSLENPINLNSMETFLVLACSFHNSRKQANLNF